MLKFFKLSNSSKPEITQTEWKGAEKATVFYFPGDGDIQDDIIEPNIARYFKTLSHPLGTSDDVLENTDLIILNMPMPETVSAAALVPEAFFNTVLETILEESNDKEKPDFFIRKELSKITFLGHSRGATIINEIGKLLVSSLEEHGFSKEKVNDICSSLFAISYGGEMGIDSLIEELPHIAFTATKDSFSTYHNPNRPNPRNPHVTSPVNEGFELHADISHKEKGNGLIIVAHKVKNYIRTIRKANPGEIVESEFGISTERSKDLITMEKSSPIGHHPYLYVNTSVELPYGSMCTFQTNPTAHIIGESLRKGMSWSIGSLEGIIRDSRQLIEKVEQEHLTPEAKEYGTALVEASEKARLAMLR